MSRVVLAQRPELSNEWRRGRVGERDTRPHLGRLVPLVPQAEAGAQGLPTAVLGRLGVRGQRDRPHRDDVGVPGGETGPEGIEGLPGLACVLSAGVWLGAGLGRKHPQVWHRVPQEPA